MSTKRRKNNSTRAVREVKGFLEGSKQLWTTLSKGTVWLAVAVGPLLLMPSLGLTKNDNKTWAYLASFLMSVAVGLVFLLANKWNRKQDLLVWAIAAAGLAFLGTAGFMGFELVKSSWTITYENQRWVIGAAADLTDAAKKLSADKPLQPAELIGLLGVKSYEDGGIWTRDSMQRRWLLMAMIRVPTFQTFGLCIITLTQALRCSVAAPGRKRGKTRPKRPPAKARTRRSARTKPVRPKPLATKVRNGLVVSRSNSVVGTGNGNGNPLKAPSGEAATQEHGL